MKARLILLLNINDIYFYYSLLIKTNAAPAASLALPPALIHSAPVCYTLFMLFDPGLI